MLPSTHDKIDLLMMSASHYCDGATQRIDLFSYLSYFFRNVKSEIYLNEVPSIVLPNMHDRFKRVNKVRMFDGFFRLFPER